MALIKSGVATIFVSDMDRAVRFYTETLGLKMEYRAGDHWAQIDAGNGFKLGLTQRASGRRRPGFAGRRAVRLRCRREDGGRRNGL